MLGEIASFQAAYARCLDDEKLEAWPDFFLADAVYRVTTADNHRRGLQAGLIWANSRAMLADRISALREANIYERHAYRHILGLPLVQWSGTIYTKHTEGGLEESGPLLRRRASAQRPRPARFTKPQRLGFRSTICIPPPRFSRACRSAARVPRFRA